MRMPVIVFKYFTVLHEEEKNLRENLFNVDKASEKQTHCKWKKWNILEENAGQTSK